MKSNKVLLIDNTIQVDRIKMPSRKVTIESILKEFQYTIATSIVLLEFKAVVIQQCITIYNQLLRKESFLYARDALLEKDHPQISLRAHIFNNLIQVFPPRGSVELDSAKDAKLAEKARLQLEVIIPELYDWFLNESLGEFGSFIKDKTACTRAQERPTKIKKCFTTNLPICRPGNRYCRVEEFIRECQPLIKKMNDALEKLPESSQPDQLTKAIKKFKEVLGSTNNYLLSHSDCRNLGDALIALEGLKSGAEEVISTNARDWKVIEDIWGLKLVKVEYPGEKTR